MLAIGQGIGNQCSLVGTKFLIKAGCRILLCLCRPVQAQKRSYIDASVNSKPLCAGDWFGCTALATVYKSCPCVPFL
jgi:hypothetical protein